MVRQSPARSSDPKATPAPQTPQSQAVTPAPILSPTNPLQHMTQEQQQQQLYSPSLSDVPLSDSSGGSGLGVRVSQSVATAALQQLASSASAPTPGSSSVAGSSSSGYYSLLDSCGGGTSGPASARSSLVSSSASFEHEPKLLLPSASASGKSGDSNSNASGEQMTTATAAVKTSANGGGSSGAGAAIGSGATPARQLPNPTQKAGRSGHSSGAPAPPPRGTTANALTQRAGAGLGASLRQSNELLSPQVPRKSGIPAPGMSTLERQRGANGTARSKSSGRVASTTNAEAATLSAIPIGGGTTPTTSSTSLASASQSQSSMASSTTSQNSVHTPSTAGIQSHQQQPLSYQSASLTRAQVSALAGGHVGSPAAVRPRAGTSGGRAGSRDEHKQETVAHSLDEHTQSMESVASSASSGVFTRNAYGR